MSTCRQRRKPIIDMFGPFNVRMLLTLKGQCCSARCDNAAAKAASMLMSLAAEATSLRPMANSNFLFFLCDFSKLLSQKNKLAMDRTLV